MATASASRPVYRAPGCVVLAKDSLGVPSANPGKKCEVEEEAFEPCGFEPPAVEPANFNPFAEQLVDVIGFAANGDAVSGHEGPTSWFSSLALGLHGGVVNFSPALAPGAATYFALEEKLTGKTITVGNATTLSTTLSGGGQSGSSISVVQGIPVSDTAALGGAGAALATGSITFEVFTNPSCTGPAISASAGAISGGPAISGSISSFAPGKYYWAAHYAGDVNNQAASSGCGEVLTVLAPTTTTTSQSGGGVSGAAITVPVGTAVSDSAQVVGALASASTGSVSYGLYKDSKCASPGTVAAAAVESKGLAGPSAPVKPAAGTYYWKATYSGDAANASSVSACGSEVLVVAKKANFGLAALSKQCVSKRKFTAHPKVPKGLKAVSVEIQINGKRSFFGKLHGRHTTINLRGLPKGTFKVAMIVVAANGQTYEDVRTFKTCVPGRHKTHNKRKK